MGQAKIVSGGPTGLYTIEIVQETSKVAARLVVIAARLKALIPLIATATSALNSAESALLTAKSGLDGSIQTSQGVGTLTAIPRWYNHGNGTVTKAFPGSTTRVGNYWMECYEVAASPKSALFRVYDPLTPLPDAYAGTAYINSGINFTINFGSVDYETGDTFDIEVAVGAEVPAVDQTTAQGKVIAAISDVTNKRRALSTLILERSSLETEQTMLNAAIVPVTRVGIWCADLTEDMAVNKVVGTIEVAGESSLIIIMPAGAAGLGKLQPTQASSPAAIFVNWATLPCWQKWKPTYRVGQIKVIGPAVDQCDVCIDEVHSSAQGLNVNQAGTVCSQTLGALYSSFTAFAAANPTHPIVTNTSDSTIAMTEQLRQDLEEINKNVNSHNNYKKDINPDGTLADQWNFLQSGASGDCEDFAITKLQMLLDKGYPISALKIEAGKTLGGAGHAWLTVQTSEGDFSLDINYGVVIPSWLLTYTDRTKQTGTEWKRSGVLLSLVPIEYMSGENAAAFEVDDRVVVAFTGQDWGSPKVIGFESHPKHRADYLIAASYVTDGTLSVIRFRIYLCDLTGAILKATITSSLSYWEFAFWWDKANNGLGIQPNMYSSKYFIVNKNYQYFKIGSLPNGSSFPTYAHVSTSSAAPDRHLVFSAWHAYILDSNYAVVKSFALPTLPEGLYYTGTNVVLLEDESIAIMVSSSTYNSSIYYIRNGAIYDIKPLITAGIYVGSIVNTWDLLDGRIAYSVPGGGGWLQLPNSMEPSKVYIAPESNPLNRVLICESEPNVYYINPWTRLPDLMPTLTCRALGNGLLAVAQSSMEHYPGWIKVFNMATGAYLYTIADSDPVTVYLSSARITNILNFTA